FLQHTIVNFVGNGSNFVVPRHVAIAAGGYSTKLRKFGAEGCEDYLLQLRITRTFKVRCVPEYLVRYRINSTNISSNHLSMALSESVALRFALQDLRKELRPISEISLMRADSYLARVAFRHAQWQIVWAVAKDIAGRGGYLAAASLLLRLALGPIKRRFIG